VHLHGKCHDVLDDLADCGADCICPFERPPGGDITDLAEIRRVLGDRVTMNGNVHTVETLIRGTPGDVRREVERIFEQWGPDPRRLILGTGDQVGRETPDENIAAMIEAGRRHSSPWQA
jgi:uroporphyrinogen-III decarboxylase